MGTDMQAQLGWLAGGVVGLLALLCCVSLARLRRREADRADAAARLELALAGADLGLWDWQVPSGVVTVNERWTAMLGYRHDELVLTFETCVQLFHPDDLPATNALIQAHLRGDTPTYEAVFRMRHKQGHWIWIMARGRVMQRDADGQAIRFLGTHADVTQDRLAKEALRQSEAWSRSLIRNLPAGVVVHEADTRVAAANPQACKVLGLSEDQMLGRAAIDPLWGLLGEDGAPLPQEDYPVNRVVQTGQPVENWFVGVRRPGETEPVWAMCNAFPIRDEAGQLRQVVVTFVDVTLRQRAVAERQLLEAQLRESQKMESIGTLAGGIAHDFNNILGAILGHAALAAQSLDAAHPVRLNLQQIAKAGTRARDLVQQILAFSRRQPQALKRQPLRPLIEESMALLRATLPTRVALVAELAAEPLRVQADATQLQQVLLNLCTNAWHAMQDRPGRIEIGLAAVDAADVPALAGWATGRHAHLWVRDDGMGIEAANLPRLFEPFFTTKSAGSGTGLGLSVVHGIVTAHHGAISVDSTPGQGSTFHVYLPTVAGADAAEAPADAASPVVGPAGVQGQHVVYVDDDEVMALMTERLLQRLGYRVTTYVDALQALAQLRAQPDAVDVLVTDFNMPGRSGVELAGELRALRPALPVIISSGYVSDELLDSARCLGVNALLHKQNTLEDIGGLIQQVLGRTAGAP